MLVENERILPLNIVSCIKLIPIYSDLFLVNMLSMFELTAEWIRVQNNAQFHCWIAGLDNTTILSQLSSGVIPSKIITKY